MYYKEDTYPLAWTTGYIRICLKRNLTMWTQLQHWTSSHGKYKDEWDAVPAFMKFTKVEKGCQEYEKYSDMC